MKLRHFVKTAVRADQQAVRFRRRCPLNLPVIVPVDGMSRLVFFTTTLEPVPWYHLLAGTMAAPLLSLHFLDLSRQFPPFAQYLHSLLHFR